MTCSHCEIRTQDELNELSQWEIITPFVGRFGMTLCPECTGVALDMLKDRFGAESLSGVGTAYLVFNERDEFIQLFRTRSQAELFVGEGDSAYRIHESSFDMPDDRRILPYWSCGIIMLTGEVDRRWGPSYRIMAPSESCWYTAEPQLGRLNAHSPVSLEHAQEHAIAVYQTWFGRS